MKKMLLGAVGLSAVLASCGAGGAPDGSGNGSVSQVRTEYRLASGQFVACDNVNNATAKTQVSVLCTGHLSFKPRLVWEMESSAA